MHMQRKGGVKMSGSEDLMRLPTGIIDDIIQGGIPVGSIVLIKGCPKSGKTVFTSQIAYNQVKSGVPVIGILADDSKEDFLTFTGELGMDFSNFQDAIQLIDIFSLRRRRSSPLNEPIISDPWDILQFMDAIKDSTLNLLMERPGHNITGFISSMNSLFFGMEKGIVYKFFSLLKDFTLKTGQVWLIELNSNVESPEVEAMLNALADGVIELRLTEEGRRFLRVYGMKKTMHSKMWIPFDIRRGGVVLGR